MNNDQRLTPVISTALMLATLVLGWYALSDRLSFPKIAVDRSLGRVPAGEQDVTARLWEDPLQAVQMEVSRLKERSGHEARNLAEAIHRKVSGPGRVCLLVVPVPGTPFPDDVETRLRLRYTVQMALSQRAYSPEDRDHLGYVELGWPGADSIHERTNHLAAGRHTASPEASCFGWSFAKRVEVPYEWFAPAEPTAPSVLVLWLPEEWLSREPLCRLAYLRWHLAPGDTVCAQQLAGLFVVGPRSSDTLKGMARVDCPADDCLCRKLLADTLSVFSAQATAPDALIGLTPANQPSAARADLETRLKQVLSPDGESDWSYFHNFIAPDDQLTDLLVWELAQRGVNYTNSQNRVLLLAEAVTRNLRLAECDAVSRTSVTAKPPPAVRKLGLLEIKRRIEDERRGAYARWIQDPALPAMMVPTGLLGILSVLFQAMFGLR